MIRLWCWYSLLAACYGCTSSPPPPPAQDCTGVSQQLQAVTRERDAARSELAALKATAVISDEHALFEQAAAMDRRENWSEAVQTYTTFLDHYPHSAMVPKAKRRLVDIQRVIATEEKKRSDEAAAAQLSSVSVAEIYAHERQYKGKTIVRKVQCHAVERAFAEMGDYQTSCSIDTSMDSRILYRERDIQALSTLPRDDIGRFSYTGTFKILGSEVEGEGIVLKYVSMAAQ